MAICNESKNKNSGPKKAKHKGKSAILEIFDRNLRKYQIWTLDSDPSHNFRKERKIHILIKSYPPWRKTWNTRRIFPTFVFCLVFLNFDFRLLYLVFHSSWVNLRSKLDYTLLSLILRRIRIQRLNLIFSKISVEYL